MAELVVLSPVHIGSGEELTSYDFVFSNGRLTVINVNAFLSANPERAEEFYTQASRHGFSLGEFLEEDEVSAYSRYTIRCRKEPQRSVSEAIKTASGGVYIPGSSIKGALRTALACYFLSMAEEDTWRKVENGERGTDIKGIRREKSDPKKVGKEVEKVIFGCGYKRDGRSVQYGDPKFDLLKFVTVRDTQPLPPGECLSVSRIKVYSINGARVSAKGFEILVESIQPGTSFGLGIEVDARALARADELESGGRWMGLQDKLERYFGVRAGDDEQKIKEKVLKTIKEACEFFYPRVIEKELSILPEDIYIHITCGSVVSNDFRAKGKKYCPKCREGGLGKEETLNVGEEIREFYRSLEGKTLLRLGFSTSWYSHTVGVMLSEDLLEYVRRRFKLGKPHSKEFPKTRRFAFDPEGSVYPPGWVEIKGVGG